MPPLGSYLIHTGFSVSLNNNCSTFIIKESVTNWNKETNKQKCPMYTFLRVGSCVYKRTSFWVNMCETAKYTEHLLNFCTSSGINNTARWKSFLQHVITTWRGPSNRLLAEKLGFSFYQFIIYACLIFKAVWTAMPYKCLLELRVLVQMNAVVSEYFSRIISRIMKCCQCFCILRDAFTSVPKSS